MTEIEKALEETSQVLTAFDIFNPDSLDKSGSTKKSFVSALINYSGNHLTDTHEKDTNAAIIDEIKTKAEVEADFFESFDASFAKLSNMIKNEAWNLVKEGKIKHSKVHNYISENVITSGDVYEIIVVDGSNQLYPNMMHLCRVSLFLPPSTANVECGYS